MGRIEDALRRLEGSPAAATPPPAEPGATPDAAAPWTFDEADRAERVDRPALEPDARRVDTPQRVVPASSMLTGEGRLRLFRGFSGKMIERLVASRNAPPALTEQFRRLAATLHHAQLAQGIKVVAVTSACARDGKTLTATNTALTLSQSYGRSVLLIDADLRRPSLHETFQIPHVEGLNEGLKADNDRKLSLLQISDNLTLLPAGRPESDPMSGLSSERMKRILQEAAARFEWVIVDTPPVGLLADATIVSGMVDATLLVVRAGETPFADVEAAVAAIGRDRILGVVLNGVDPANVQANDYYYHYYSGRSGGGPPSR
ncbi:MAG: CpsD/CapB family tyrosine-protein kinase [Acidobacteria bacterium]|nr:CpsD/CapB family tyrosine-protein kinase [Acidobacteriota bacterium]